MSLARKKCKPCEGGVAAFDKSQAKSFLEKVEDWELADQNKSIVKTLSFENFMQVIEFVNKVAEIAEDEDHHPDLLIHDYKKLKISLTTHAIGGLSENDFIMAAKIDKLKDS